MKNLRFGLNILAGAVLALALSAAANAQASRTWVSGVGDDLNTCTRTAPCKTFATALSRTASGGEIDCLDPAGFGAVTINKSITIDCDAGTGGIIAAATTDLIYLRHMNINGESKGTAPGVTGISITSAGTVHLQQVDIFGFSS